MSQDPRRYIPNNHPRVGKNGTILVGNDPEDFSVSRLRPGGDDEKKRECKGK